MPLNAPLQSLSGLSVTSTQWVAWQFTLDQSYEVSDLQAWAYGATASPSNNVYMQLFTGTSGVPYPYEKDWLFTTHFVLPYHNNLTSNIGWYGPHFDTPVVLEAGTYWMSVSSYGDIVGMPDDGSTQSWVQATLAGQTDHSWDTSGSITYYHLGWRVLGEASPVPIPAAVWLLGSGLIGLVGIRRKINK